jgi:enoyl-CoA hydratase
MTEQHVDREVIAERRGRLGILTLNRPKALNALSLTMVELLDATLAEWAGDPAIDAVLLRGTGRAFCAGGDVRAIGGLADPAARAELARRFFGTEYRLNLRIHTYAKPFIALAHGIVFGGGMGVSVHGAFRIVDETTVMAMPETALGLFPDVGATWFLNRCPGRLGLYLGLTGVRLRAADAIWSGLATHFVPAERSTALVDALAELPALNRESISSAIAGYTADPGTGDAALRSAGIDAAFAKERLEDVIEGLADGTESWQTEAYAALRRASPTSLRATWRRLLNAPGQTIEEVLADDLRMAVNIVRGHDFAEGVRAILIDKDNTPAWIPATLQDVSAADVDALLSDCT